jgi:hypothetical protein
LGISIRQVFRYLKSLREEDRIRIDTGFVYLTKDTASGFACHRSIYFNCEANDQIKEIRRKYCQEHSEDIGRRKSANKVQALKTKDTISQQKQVLSKQVVEVKQVEVKEEPKLSPGINPDLIYTNTDPEKPSQVWYNPFAEYEERRMSTKQTYWYNPFSDPESENHSFVSTLSKETKELVEKTLEEERIRRDIEHDNMILKKEILKWQGISDPVVGETTRDQLINAYLGHHTRTVERLKSLDIYESVRNHQVPPPEVLSKENGEYYISLSIPAEAGTIDFKIKLFEYVTWREDSWEYKEMEKGIKEQVNE